ncbi:DUF6132 family protein [Candidatus Omnitrophota bacterium]
MKIVLGMLIGGVLGFAIGYLGKCSSGVCLLTRNPVITAAVGALLGLMVVLGK